MHQRKHEAHMSNDVRIAILENTIGHVNETLLRFDQKMDILGNQLNVKIESLSNQLNTKMDNLGNQLNAKIENVGNQLNTKIDNVDRQLNAKIDNLDHQLSTRIDKVDQRIDRIESRLWIHFLWLLSAIMGLAGIMARGFHWL